MFLMELRTFIIIIIIITTIIIIIIIIIIMRFQRGKVHIYSELHIKLGQT
jgi:hypothetical protein